MPQLKRRPLFIVFEGIDGSGKSTQAKMLVTDLEAADIENVLTSEPSSDLIRRLTSVQGRPDPKEEALLFTKDRHDHVKRVILPALEAGRTVICDRYI